MATTGFINVHAYTSNAKIPLDDVTVAITNMNQNPIAFRLTNSSGNFENPIELEVPDQSDSLTPNANAMPFLAVNIYARKANFQEIYVQNVQVFANTVTVQDLELIPLSEYPADRFRSERFDTLTQSL